MPATLYDNVPQQRENEQAHITDDVQQLVADKGPECSCAVRVMLHMLGHPTEEKCGEVTAVSQSGSSKPGASRG